MWITSGYSEALANDGPFSEIAAYLLASVILLWTAVRGMPRRTGWCFGVCLALFLFVTFKASFVRHDGFHAAIALASLVFGVLAIGMLRKSFPVQALLLLATLMTACSFMRYQSVLLEEAEQKGPAEVQEASQMSMSALGRRAVSALIRETDLNARRMLADVEAGIRLRRAPGTRLEQRFEADRQAIHALMKIPAFVDGADIYSFEQAHLLASGTRWQPRPTFQSYQAYDRLMRLNAEHLTSIAAPEHVLLRVAPIDGHLPSLEDGPSWRMLLAAYQPDGMVAGFVHLRKRAQPLSYTESPLSEQHASMGESIALPASGGLVWARIDVEPTWFGRLWATGFKPPQLTMQVELTTGETKEFRVLSNMMREGFLLAPFVSDTDGFMALALSGEAGSSLSRVVRLSIAPAYGAGVLWQSAYSLSLSREADAMPPIDRC
jgi:hypothetical protein